MGESSLTEEQVVQELFSLTDSNVERMEQEFSSLTESKVKGIEQLMVKPKVFSSYRDSRIDDVEEIVENLEEKFSSDILEEIVENFEKFSSDNVEELVENLEEKFSSLVESYIEEWCETDVQLENEFSGLFDNSIELEEKTEQMEKRFSNLVNSHVEDRKEDYSYLSLQEKLNDKYSFAKVSSNYPTSTSKCPTLPPILEEDLLHEDLLTVIMRNVL